MAEIAGFDSFFWWALALMLSSIVWLVVGAAVLAAVDYDEEFLRFVEERRCAQLALWFWPIAIFAILSGRKRSTDKNLF